MSFVKMVALVVFADLAFLKKKLILRMIILCFCMEEKSTRFPFLIKMYWVCIWDVKSYRKVNLSKQYFYRTLRHIMLFGLIELGLKQDQATGL